MAKKNERSQGSKKAQPKKAESKTAKPSAARGNSTAPKGQVLHPDHPVTVTLTADHDETDVITGYPDFLERLAQDDAFRTRLRQDPDRMMAALGVRFNPPLSTAFAPNEIALPPKDKVRELLDSLPRTRTLRGHFNLLFNFWAVITTGGRS